MIGAILISLFLIGAPFLIPMANASIASSMNDTQMCNIYHQCVNNHTPFTFHWYNPLGAAAGLN